MERYIITSIGAGITLIALGRVESGATLLMCILGVAIFNGLAATLQK